MRELGEQELVRREKLEKLKELGLEPLGHRYERDSNDKEIKDIATSLKKELKI